MTSRDRAAWTRLLGEDLALAKYKSDSTHTPLGFQTFRPTLFYKHSGSAVRIGKRGRMVGAPKWSQIMWAIKWIEAWRADHYHGQHVHVPSEEEFVAEYAARRRPPRRS